MGVDAALHRAQQSRFAVVAAADDHGYPFGHPHPRDPPAAGQVEGDSQVVRARERHSGVTGERKVAVAGATGQNGPVADECDQSPVGQKGADMLLIAQQGDVLAQGAPVEVRVQ